MVVAIVTAVAKPLLKSAIKGGIILYERGREAAAELVEMVEDVAAGVRSELAHAVTTQAGGYVQGGGCMTVGVAGLVLSGGFGSFSKAFGLAAASLLQAEIVTADGSVRIANACTNPGLFWALKSGGGGSLGVVTRLTLKVHEPPEAFGAVNFTVEATSAPAFRKLIALVIDLSATSLMNPHWGTAEARFAGPGQQRLDDLLGEDEPGGEDAHGSGLGAIAPGLGYALTESSRSARCGRHSHNDPRETGRSRQTSRRLVPSHLRTREPSGRL